MKVIEIIDFFKSKYTGNSGNPSKYHPEIIRQAIGRAFNDLIYETFKVNVSDLDIYCKTYQNPPVTVSLDSTSQQYYSILPESIIQLPRGAGIRLIRPIGELYENFIPVQDNANSIFNRLPVNIVSKRSEYSIDRVSGQDRLRVNYYKLPEGITSVVMKLVIPFEKYDDDDEFFIPSGKDTLMLEILNNFFSTVLPAKTTNDNTDKVA